MTGHRHAASMAEYAKDAIETAKPWERWEMVSPNGNVGILMNHPGWSLDVIYRRKRTPLCQVEGRDVFPGDRLWHRSAHRWLVIAAYGQYHNCLATEEYGPANIAELSWTEPPRTKTVYQWAIRDTSGNWAIGSSLRATEEEISELYNWGTGFKRLAPVEVPV